MKKTRQRGEYKTRAYFLVREILLDAGGKHLRADEVHERLRARGEHVGLTTVYRQLSRLESEGFLRKTTTEGIGNCYSLLGEHCASHYHLVCTECGALSHLSCDHIAALIHHITTEHGFLISPERTTLYGLCASCVRKKRKETV